MEDKLIYLEQNEDKHKHDTWVRLIGAGNYAINQTQMFNKGLHHTIYLTREQLREILKEKQVQTISK